MSTQPIPIGQFAGLIRKKFPGAYDSVPDASLVGKWMEKYPEYKDRVAGFAETQFEKQHASPDQGAISGIGSAVSSMIPNTDSVGGFAGSELGAVKQFFDPVGSGIDTAREAIRRAARPMTSDKGVGYRAANAASVLVPGLNPESMERRAETGDTSGIIGEAAVPTVLALSPYVKKAGSAARSAIGNAMFEPVGDALSPSASPTGSMSEFAFKPKVKTALRVAGGTVGALPGVFSANPYEAVAGGSFGAGLGPSMAEAMFKPQPKPVFPGAPFPAAEESYAARGADFNAANKQAAQIAKMQAKIPDWEPPTHDVFELGSPEYPGPTSKIPSRVAPQFRGDPFAPPTGESPFMEWEPESEMLRRGVGGVNPSLKSIRRNYSDPQDLISRMQKLAIPGEAPSAEDLKRAGDFTQVSTDKLRTLARFGDKLAQNELNRRLKQ